MLLISQQVRPAPLPSRRPPVVRAKLRSTSRGMARKLVQCAVRIRHPPHSCGRSASCASRRSSNPAGRRATPGFGIATRPLSLRFREARCQELNSFPRTLYALQRRRAVADGPEPESRGHRGRFRGEIVCALLPLVLVTPVLKVTNGGPAAFYAVPWRRAGHALRPVQSTAAGPDPPSNRHRRSWRLAPTPS
jgi:hypothetical protein